MTFSKHGFLSADFVVADYIEIVNIDYNDVLNDPSSDTLADQSLENARLESIIPGEFINVQC